MVISTAKLPPCKIAVCGCASGATEQPSCRRLAGHDLDGKTEAYPPEVVATPENPASPKISA
jgi:hypothetical protein